MLNKFEINLLFLLDPSGEIYGTFGSVQTRIFAQISRSLLVGSRLDYFRGCLNSIIECATDDFVPANWARRKNKHSLQSWDCIGTPGVVKNKASLKAVLSFLMIRLNATTRRKVRLEFARKRFFHNVRNIVKNLGNATDVYFYVYKAFARV